MITKICIKCGEEKELSEFHRRGKNGRRSNCKICDSKRRHIDYINNREKELKQRKQYRSKNLKLIKERKRNHYINNKDDIIKSVKKWRKDNREKFDIICKRYVEKRRRNFGFIPLNEKFEGSVGHHISKDLVIFIPEELHKSVPHKYNDPISMGKINGLALEFMMPEVG